jgi:hypothetical protein
MNTTQLTKRPPRLKNLRIDEVSSVDRGAGEGVRVVLAKRAPDIGDEITRGFNALHESCASIIEDGADFDKAEALAITMEQAHEHFAKLLDPTDDDRHIDNEDDSTVAIDEKGKKRMSSYDQLMGKAAELRAADPKLSEHQAFAKVYSDRNNADPR